MPPAVDLVPEPPAPSPHPATDPPRSRRAVAGWVLYDFANVIFSLSVVSLYFPLWVTEDAGGRDAHYGIANGGSMAIVLLIAPLVGTLADLVPRRTTLLAAATLGCCLATALLGTGGLTFSLVCFVVANVSFQAGLNVYDGLLPVVSTPENRGRISSYGIAAGFGGALVSVLVGILVLALDPHGKPLVFKLTAVLFLAGALPCFLWLREPNRVRHAAHRDTLRDAALRARHSLAFLRQHPPLARFLIGRVFYADATSTLLAFMGIYAARELGFSDLQVQLVLLTGILTGPIGALGAGRVTDVIGPRRTLNFALAGWVVIFGISALVPALGLPAPLFWIVAPLIGIALGASSTVERPYLLRLAPPERVGHAVGLFGLVGRFSSVTGPLLWAAIVDGLDLGRPAAVGTLALFVIVSLVVLRPLSDNWPAA